MGLWGLFGGHFGGLGLGVLFYLLFRLYGESLLCQQQQRSNQENAAPRHKPSLKSNEGSIVTPDLCGCCGTHELQEASSVIRSDILTDGPT